METVKASPQKLTTNTKIIIGVVIAAILIAAGLFGLPKVNKVLQKQKSCNAASQEISELMESFGLYKYKVTEASVLGTKVLCRDFEKLSDHDKYLLIIATRRLNSIKVKDDKIDLECSFYVNKRDHYYYVGSFQVDNPSSNYYQKGIYKMENGENIYCVYAEP